MLMAMIGYWQSVRTGATTKIKRKQYQKKLIVEKKTILWCRAKDADQFIRDIDYFPRNDCWLGVR